MKSLPRILALAGVAAGGVLALKALSGADSLPAMLGTAKAFAEDVAPRAGKAALKAASAEDKSAQTPAAAQVAAAKPAAPPPPACAPGAAQLAKDAGLSPAELSLLQKLGARRGELDQREAGLDVQLQLVNAAEAKLDAKEKALTQLRAEIQGLLGQADTKQSAELDRLVTVYAAMKPKEAAARMVLLDDPIRLPIAAKLKERTLAAILAEMPAPEAKTLTEHLARRFAAQDNPLAQAKSALDPNAPAPAAAPAAGKKPAPAAKAG